MQIVQYKALRTLLKALPGGVVRDGSFGRNIKAKNDFFAPSKKSAGRGGNVPVNNC
jgi:hypothetical protein